MNLEELRSKGGFVDTAPVPVDVEWTHAVDGVETTESFTIHVRKLSFGVVERLFVKGDRERSSTAVLISECVVFGDERMTYEQALDLDPELAQALSAGVAKVNELGTARKN